MRRIETVGLAAELAAFAEKHGDVTLGVVGAGQMGTDLAVQCALVKGVRLGAICARSRASVAPAMEMSGLDWAEARGADAVDRAIEAGRTAWVEDFRDLCRSGRVQVVVDATGNPNTGAEIAFEAFRNGKHLVMLNVEADITIGRLLKREAARAGVVYTGAAGDEPAATVELIGLAQSLGLDIVSAGKGKNNALKFDAMPAEFEEEAARRNMNARVLVEFVDGSKTMVEMVAIANATGLKPDVPGMHGPAAGLDTLAQVLCAREDGGILSQGGCVDYTIGRGVAPGVFAVVKPRHPRVMERITDLKVGPGPCYTLTRPFHLTSLEVPLSAIKAVMRNQPDLQPLDYPVAECGAVAKRDLRPGETLGKIGETQYRGFALTWEEGRASEALPLGLAEHARVIRPVAKGERLTHQNCAADETLLVTKLRRQLDVDDARFLPDVAA